MKPWNGARALGCRAQEPSAGHRPRTRLSKSADSPLHRPRRVSRWIRNDPGPDPRRPPSGTPRPTAGPRRRSHRTLGSTWARPPRVAGPTSPSRPRLVRRRAIRSCRRSAVIVGPSLARPQPWWSPWLPSQSRLPSRAMTRRPGRRRLPPPWRKSRPAPLPPYRHPRQRRAQHRLRPHPRPLPRRLPAVQFLTPTR